LKFEDNRSEEGKFEYFDVTADVGFKAYGESLDTAFENAALAMFNVITNTSKIQPLIKKKIEIKAEDDHALLFDWLTELLILHDSEYLVFSKFKVDIKNKENEYHLKGELWGEEFNPDIHEARSEVKAVTYHMMDIKKNNNFILQVILDI